MRDYDVEVLGLAVPEVTAPVASYRPAVLVRNNGIYPANVTGTLRVYRREPPGELLATFEISLVALQPGATGNAQSSQYWSPTAADIGREFLFAADVTTDNDQLEQNNHLGPVTVMVTAAEPEPPAPVQPHATQHEAAGQDPVDVTGLAGALADPQTPTAHKASHQVAGSDPINVGSLTGLLADPQTPTIHATSHKLGGSDHINVDELEGATDIEHTANKSQANGYASLNNDTIVPNAEIASATTAGGGAKFLKSDRFWANVLPVGIICAWDSTNPAPTDWTQAMVVPGLTLPHIWIKYNPPAD